MFAKRFRVAGIPPWITINTAFLAVFGLVARAGHTAGPASR